jgi:hypothetical protein
MSRRRKGFHLLGLVLSVSLLSCSSDEPKVLAEFNQSASLVGALPENPLQWKIITSAIDSAASTMSTLYGNDLAVEHARTNSQHDYPVGSVLSLVTWTQTEDRRWFGAKIPEHVKSVEFVIVATASENQRSYSYQEYEGTPLKMISVEQSVTPNARAAYLLSQRAAVMP